MGVATMGAGGAAGARGGAGGKPKVKAEQPPVPTSYVWQAASLVLRCSLSLTMVPIVIVNSSSFFSFLLLRTYAFFLHPCRCPHPPISGATTLSGKQLWVENLPYTTETGSLRSLFAVYGAFPRASHTHARKAHRRLTYHSKVYPSIAPLQPPHQPHLLLLLLWFLHTTGDLESCEVLKWRSGRSRGTATVRFLRKADAASAIDDLDGFELGGRNIHVRYDRFGNDDEDADDDAAATAAAAATAGDVAAVAVADDEDGVAASRAADIAASALAM